jgi:hypothetical protein
MNAMSAKAAVKALQAANFSTTSFIGLHHYARRTGYYGGGRQAG